MWDGPSPSHRIKDYLDPNDTGAQSVEPVAGYDLTVENLTFDDPNTDPAAGFYRTAGSIDVSNTTVESGSDLTLRAREGITINGPFEVEKGATFTAKIDDGPKLSNIVPPSSPSTRLAQSGGGEESASVSAKQEEQAEQEEAPGKRDVPATYGLAENYPNPLRRATTIRYQLPEQAHISLALYDVLGRRVATLADETKPAGRYRARLEAADLPSGVYLYRLRAGSFTKTRRLVVMR